MDRSFPGSRRLRRRGEFDLVFEEGAKRHGRLMSVFVLKKAGGDARLGIAASRKVGGAVTRNRAKRRVREAFRCAPPDSGIEVVVVPRRELCSAPFVRLTEELSSLVELALRHGRRREHPAPTPRSPGVDSRV